MSLLTKELIKDRDCDLDFLIGKTITNIGFVRGHEGGLTIDYGDEAKTPHRAILGFTDLGMWVAFNGPKGESAASIVMKSIRDNEDDIIGVKKIVVTDNYLILKCENRQFEYDINLIPAEIVELAKNFKDCEDCRESSDFSFMFALTAWADIGK